MTEELRYEVTVRARPGGPPTIRVADLDLDRVPDPAGDTRLLVSADDLARLQDEGFDVRVEREVPVRPLDPGLVADDASVRAWFDEQVGER